MAIGNFGNKKPATAGAKPTATTAKPRPQAKPVQRVSKYANVEEQENRDPMPVIGAYRFRVLGCEDNPSPKNRSVSWFKALLEIVALEGDQAEATHCVGDTVAMLQQSAGNGATQGLPRIKSFVRHAAGFETEADYNEYDPVAGFIDAVTGIQNEYTERGETIVGRLVDCQVTRGRDTGTGDYYREYAWGIVPDEEQDQ